MKICVNDMLFGISYALDAVEASVLGVTTYHSKRVAYITTLMAGTQGLSDREQLLLAIASVLHDNALTEYVQQEGFKGINIKSLDISSDLGMHCRLGEENVHILPFYGDISNVILFHHERADGNGPFGKKPDEIPIFSRMIHLADTIDSNFDIGTITGEKYEKIIQYLLNNVDTIFDREVVDIFVQNISYASLMNIHNDNIDEKLFSHLPQITKDYSSEEILEFAELFAKIVDYKSPFTTNHSIGIAQKAKKMGEYYGLDSELCNELFFAGAMHDIGKLLIPNEILEKPGRLSDTEFKEIQNHAIGTYVILESIKGLETITKWASRHHEKLDGTGYPFGLKADELDKYDRLMACIDIYQALVESRPYKDGMPHDKAMEILFDMASQGKIDGEICKDIDNCFQNHVEAMN